uniref:WGS project CAEQ00000000 data, annotated contig 2020 n=1 Tax=Trypanosoma congolense (strain IL3000) TaxID=1068625 RepID=F9WAV3_TRYCI|nr:unnamed protein product [Trypanosoma congolense IL3000]
MGRKRHSNATGATKTVSNGECPPNWCTAKASDDVMHGLGKTPDTTEHASSQKEVEKGESDMAEAVARHFSEVEIFFQLAAERRRAGFLYPRDIGTLLLWSVPSAVPLVEGPKVFFIKNRSKVRDVVVIYVNGWSYDDMLLAEAGEPGMGGGSKEVAGEAAVKGPDGKGTFCEQRGKRPREEMLEGGDAPETFEGEQWSARAGHAMLCLIRQQQCWARIACGVQFAPIVVTKGSMRFERDIFWRNEKSKTAVANQLEDGQNRLKGENQGEVVNHEGNTGKGSALPKGVDALFSRALTINSGESNVPAGTPGSAPSAPLESLRYLSHPPDGGPSLWEREDLLLQYALSLEKDRAALEGLGFVLDVPEGEDPSAWKSFGVVDRSQANGDSLPHVLALDCEMVLVRNHVSALARVSLVDVRAGTVVLDSLVKPAEEVLDYVTRYSGIDEAMLEGVTTTLEDCQQLLKKYISTSTFLIGHSLENDLRACKMLPNCQILDTAYLFPHPSGLPCKNSLRYLAMRYLKKTIQQGSHDSQIDACTSAELLHLKLKHGPEFGVFMKLSVLGAIDGASLPSEGGDGGQDPSSSSVEIHLFDDACTLSEIVPHSKGKGACGINAVPVRHDEDAVRKAVRCLQRRCDAHKNPADDTSLSYALVWIQLSETSVPVGAEALEGEQRTREELEMERVNETNRRVMRIVQATPHNSLIVVVAAAPAGGVVDVGKNNKGDLSASQAGSCRGACFAFVKDDAATGPLATWLNPKESEQKETAEVVDGTSEEVPIVPVCQQQ